MISVFPCIEFIAFGVMFAFPMYSTVMLLKDKTQSVAQAQWLAYWTIYIIYQQFKEYLLVYITEYIPLYPEIEALIFLWLIHPGFLGALFIWEKLQPIHKPHDEKFFTKVREIFPAPSAQKKFDAAQEEKPVKAEIVEKVKEAVKEVVKEELPDVPDVPQVSEPEQQ